MAGLWFSPDNLQGKLEAPITGFSDSGGMYPSTSWYFYAQVYLDSSVKETNIPILMSTGGTFRDIDRFNKNLKIYIENGILSVYGVSGSTVSARGYSKLEVPFDVFFEMYITVNPSNSDASKRVYMFVDGAEQEVIDPYSASSNAYNAIGDYSKFYVGGTSAVFNQAKGLFLRKVIFGNFDRYNIFPPISVSSGVDVFFEWNFENDDNLSRLKSVRSGNTYYFDFENTEPQNIVWIDESTPPTDSDGGGIVIPGNGNTTQVQGVITENNQPVACLVYAITKAKLEVAGVNDTQHAVLDSTYSQTSDGSYTLDTSPYEGEVMILAMDDYGSVWLPDTAYEIGDVIRPAEFQAYVYHCTIAGTSDSVEPQWWFDTESNQSIGTAQFKAKPYSRPLAHSPIIPEIITPEE